MSAPPFSYQHWRGGSNGAPIYLPGSQYRRPYSVIRGITTPDDGRTFFIGVLCRSEPLLD